MFKLDPIKLREKQAEVEREWRNEQLIKADVEINKLEDTNGAGTAVDWREYRKSLRDWPESPDFPEITKRPVAPNNS